MFHFSSISFSLFLSLSPSFFLKSFFLGLFFLSPSPFFILLFVCPPHFSPSFSPSLFIFSIYSFFHLFLHFHFCLYRFLFLFSPFFPSLFFFYISFFSPPTLVFLSLFIQTLVRKMFLPPFFPLSLFLDLICVYLPCLLTSPVCNSNVLDLIFLFRLLFIFLSFSLFLISIHHFFVSFAFFLISFFYTFLNAFFFTSFFMLWTSPFRILICHFL